MLTVDDIEKHIRICMNQLNKPVDQIPDHFDKGYRLGTLNTLDAILRYLLENK